MLKIKDFRNHRDLTHEQLEELETRLRKASHESRVPCASALEIAKTLEIPTAEVGKTANKLNIRIKKCLLGCF
jgi:LAO/AO transport system kinase